MAVNLQIASKEYFSNLNSLAKKISVDIEHTQEVYQEFWHSLSAADQHQVVDENIICPSAVIKYARLPAAELKDNPNTHSWFTRSQLDLFNQNQSILGRSSTYITNLESTNKLEESKIGSSNQKSKSNRVEEISAEKTNSIKLQKQSVLKPRIPPPPPPSRSRISSVEFEASETSSVVDSATDIPKTGFDFLDNW